MQSSSPLRGSPVYVLVIFVAMFTLYMVLHEKSFRVIYSEGNVDDLLQPQGAQTIRDKLASLVEPVRIRLLRSGQRAAGNENGVGVASVRVTLIPKEQSEKGVTDAPLEQDVPPIDDGKRKENNMQVSMFQGNEANYEKQANTVQHQRAAGEAQQEEEQPTVDKAEPEEPNEDAKQKEEQQKAAVDEKQKEEQQKATVEKLKEEQQKAIQEAKQNEEPKKATEEAKQKEAQTKAAEEAKKERGTDEGSRGGKTERATAEGGAGGKAEGATAEWRREG